MAQVYHQARTAHLERLRADADQADRAGTVAPTRTTLLYQHARYDFEAALTQGLDVHRVSARSATRWALRTEVDVLEVTEPAYWPGIRLAAAAVLGIRIRDVMRGRRTRVVSYAIGNSDPRRDADPRGVRGLLGVAVNRVLARLVMAQCDALVFGTPAARSTYAGLFGAPPRRQRRTEIVALPAACADCDLTMPRNGIVYLGAFVERKGVRELLAAWRLLPPEAELRLTLIGKGPLSGEVEALAAADPRVEVVLDPPRTQIHDVLAQARTLVLASRRSPRWREQVGLPLIEALQHGVHVISSDETGIAPWLREHGHRVVSADATPQELADALLEVSRAPLAPSAVVSSLPAVDGRRAAHQWITRP